MMNQVNNSNSNFLSDEKNVKIIKSALGYYLNSSRFRHFANQSELSYEDLYQEVITIFIRKDVMGKYDQTKSKVSNYIYSVISNILSDINTKYNADYRSIGFNSVSYDAVVDLEESESSFKDKVLVDTTSSVQYDDLEFYGYYKNVLNEFQYSVFESLIQGFTLPKIAEKLNTSKFLVKSAVESIKDVVSVSTHLEMNS